MAAAKTPERQPLPFDPIAEASRNWAGAGWGEVVDGMAFVTSVMRVQQILLARVDDCLASFGLTFSRFEVLMLLSFSRRGELPLGKIGTRLQVHAASVTNAIDRLESQDFVKRLPHPTDGRTTLARLTPSGRRTATRAAYLLNEQVFSAPGLHGDDLRRAVRVLAEVRRAAGDFDGPGLTRSG